MKNLIFYFSGTGNTYWAAKSVAESIGDCELINIASFDCSQNIVAERVGIFYPIYYWGLPNIIKNFVNSVHIEADYIFNFHTMGGYDGVATKQLTQSLIAHNMKLSATYRLRMPNNLALISKSNIFSDVYRIPNDNTISHQLRNAKKLLQKYSKYIIAKKRHTYKNFFFLWNKYGYKLNEKECSTFSNKGEAFTKTLESSCTGCGHCSVVCPVGNITMKDGKPKWGERCEFCVACLHSCPQKAINYGYSKGKKRYTFPKDNC